jgi:chromosome segregation ATPase
MGSGDITREDDKLDRILAELAEIRGTMNGLGNELASVKTELASVKTEVGSGNSEVGSGKSEGGPVKTEVVLVKGELASVKSNAASNKVYFESRFDSLERTIGSLEESFEKKLIETKPVWVAELDAKIEGLRREITGKMRDFRQRFNSGALLSAGSRRAGH